MTGLYIGIGTSVLPFLPATRVGYHVGERFAVEGGGGLYTFNSRSESPSYYSDSLMDVSTLSGRLVVFNLPLRIKPFSSERAFLSLDVGPRVLFLNAVQKDSILDVCYTDTPPYYTLCYHTTGSEISMSSFGVVFGLGVEYFITSGLSLYAGVSSSYMAINIGGKSIDRWYADKVRDESQEFSPSKLSIFSLGTSNINLSLNAHLK